ncbi:MAG: AarF/UbiB family protein [bacterium]|nr:AarF/UbiB family protein [bacterium]
MNDVLDGIGNFTGLMIAAGMWALMIWLIATTVRRVLGVRVGWPRTIVVAFINTWALNALIDWAMEISGFNRVDADEPATLAAFVLFYGMLFLWAFALGALLLVATEIILPTGTLPSARQLFFGWGRRWRRFRRYTQILVIFAKNGLTSQLRGFRAPDEDADGGHEVARSLRIALDQCGITFIKAGQVLSTRADLIPKAFVEELSKLQTTAEPVSWEEWKGALEECIGAPADSMFSHVEREPLAAASGAQVHLARLKDGREVVVKVQRPEAARTAALDLDIMLRMCRMLDRNAPWAHRMGLLGLAEGFAASIREELDYREEIDNMAAMRASLDRRGVRVPTVERELCSPRNIVMEKFDGKPVSKAEFIHGLSREQRQASAQVLLEAVLDQIVNEGLFHADLHPGNVFIWPDGTVGLLDFGSVGRLDATSRRALARLLWAIDADDPVMATDSLLGIVDAPKDLDERLLTREIGGLLAKFRGGIGLGTGSMEVFTDLFQLMLDHGLGVPAQLGAALRSLAALEGTLLLIDPELDLVEAARKTGRETIGKITPERIKNEMMAQFMHVMPLIEHLPSRLNRITEDLETGNFRANIRILDDPEDRRFLDGLVQQLVTAVLAVGAVLGGIMLATNPGGPDLLPEVTLYNFFGSLLAFAGFVLALRSVAHVFSRTRRKT